MAYRTAAVGGAVLLAALGCGRSAAPVGSAPPPPAAVTVDATREGPARLATADGGSRYPAAK